MAAFFGVIALRATGLGFLMITLALSQVLWGSPTACPTSPTATMGSRLTRPAPFGVSLDRPVSFYWFVLIVAVIAFLMMTIFVSSAFGSSLKEYAINAPDGRTRFQSVADQMDHIRLCRLLGRRLRITLRLLSQIYHPTSLSTTSSAEALLGVIAGGSGTLGGPVAGAALVL